MKKFGKTLIWFAIIALPAKWIGGSLGASSVGGKYTMPTSELFSTVVICIFLGVIGWLIVRSANKREQKVEEEQDHGNDGN